MKKALIAIAAVVMTVSASYAQVLVAGWDFQTTTTGGTAIAAAPATSKIYTANFGAGTLYFDGSNGSSNWFVPASGSTNTELNAFGGSSVNTLASDGTLLSSVTTGSAALAVIGGAGTGTAANGKSAVFAFSMAGKADLSISLSAQRSTTGFATQLWEYSADGGSTWGNIGSFVAGTTAGTIQDTFAKSGVLSFASFSALDGVSDARLRVTFTGSSATAGNNRLDNIQLNAVVVPEPSSGALLVLGGVSLVAIRSLRKKNS
jgi:hypothetical protein